MSDSLKIRLTALLFISTGITFLVLYLSGYRPAFLQIPVFAVASTYTQNRFFQMVETNAIDEIAFLLMAVGFSLLVWNTFKENVIERQAKAFRFALKYTFIFAVLAYLFVFGYAIFGGY